MPKPADRSNSKKKRKYRSDGTLIWSRPVIDGPGVWVSCVKGREDRTVAEVSDLFDMLASELWPEPSGGGNNHSDDDDSKAELSLEAQISKELSAIKRPKSERRFVNCMTNTPCVVFISCRPPVDPVKLVETHIKNVKDSGVTRTRYAHRFVPVSGSCNTNIQDIQTLCRTVFSAFFSQEPDKLYTYKVELRSRNHNTLARPDIIQTVAACVPPGHTVNLVDPQLFILVEIFKSVCGIAVTKEYYSLYKYNVMEIASKSAPLTDDN
ncbi:hypothetical protein C8J56DRAFT_929949 [Mycena floridula]|nr:hypothetical protein C8J56DRAFT_929949 [Mycena floridula]